MLGTMKRFFADRKGAFAMQFALLVVPLTVCTGLAIDGGRAFLARYELASALDAAALAVGSTTNENSDLNVIAHSFVNSNFHTEHNGEIDLELQVDDGDDDIVYLKGTVTIDTYFMPLIGQPTVTVSAESQVKKGGANVEVALALDVTGSMEESSDGKTRIEALKSASNLLIDKVVNPIQTPYFSKVAIVPWSSAVHVGSTHVDADAEDLRGALVGSTSISGASWRKPATSTKTIIEAGWRTAATAGGKGISGVSWKNGGAINISTITKLTSPSRIRVTTGSTSHGYTTGEHVRITGANGDYTGLNTNIYVVETVSSTTYYLRTLDNSAYVTPPTGSSNATMGSSQLCYDSACNVAITTSSNHTLSVGDFAHITGVNGFTEVNNGDTETWVVASVPSTTRYTISGPTGPAITSTYSTSSGDRSSECYVSDCRYRVTTSADHGFSTSDHIFIWGVSQSGSGTSITNAVNTTWTGVSKIESPAGAVFYLPYDGVDYQDWTSGGSVAQCANDKCNVVVNAPSHGLAAGEFVRIRSATGLTGINNCDLDSNGKCASGSTPVAWEIVDVSGNDLQLKDSVPTYSGMDGTYGSGGTAQCTRYGCALFRFLNTSNAARIYKPTQCIVERYGDDADTDADPADSPLGINYTNDGVCDADTANYVTPLTSNRTRLTDAITALKTGGSTAGQLGVGWGWYLLSENFDTVWAKEEENKPKPYDSKELVKVMVLMTDGEFNFMTCNGVSSSSIQNCSQNGTPKVPFKRAEDLCDAAKAKKIIIYTVGMQLDTSLYSDEFLTYCATSPEHAFLANSNTELEEAFKKIAKEISKLRIAR
jgi:Flp pilus assembly protein TadG